MSDLSNDSVALLVDEHELFRAGASAMLVRDCGFGEVLEAASLAEALALLGDNPGISLACFDLALQGLTTPLDLKQVRERHPTVRVALFTAFDSRENIILALEAGLHGFVAKTLAVPEIVKAFQIILSGGIYVPQTVAELPGPDTPVVTRSSLIGGAGAIDATPYQAGVRLTKRQHEILRLIRRGRSNREIGWRLGLSENTVKVHINALFKKLRVHSRFQAAAMTMTGFSEMRDDVAEDIQE